jgi:hypothetical protein
MRVTRRAAGYSPLAIDSCLNQSCGTSLSANPFARFKTMRPARSARAQVLVETEVFGNVRSAIQSGQSPILVLGAPGSGKTTLLRTMYNEWMQAGMRAVYIPLREVARNEDLYLLVRRALTDESAASPLGAAPLGASPLGGTNVIASSGRATLRSTVDIIRSLPFEPLLLFDGLDEMSDSSGVLQLVDLLSGSPVKVAWPLGFHRTPPEAAVCFDQSSKCPNLRPPKHTISSKSASSVTL